MTLKIRELWEKLWADNRYAFYLAWGPTKREVRSKRKSKLSIVKRNGRECSRHRFQQSSGRWKVNGGCCGLIKISGGIIGRSTRWRAGRNRSQCTGWNLGRFWGQKQWKLKRQKWAMGLTQRVCLCGTNSNVFAPFLPSLHTQSDWNTVFTLKQKRRELCSKEVEGTACRELRLLALSVDAPE